MIELRNGRVALALHPLASAAGLPLLVLHELGGSAAQGRAETLAWPGPAYALDFSGHGHSGRVYAGGYYPELWAADADSALAALGEAVVLGSGLGAYAALMLAGGRPSHVRCAVLRGGAGLDGGGPVPRFPPEVAPPDIATAAAARDLQATSSTDPAVHVGQDLYVRPPDYAARFAAAARRVLLVEDGGPLPPWWRALHEVAGVERRSSLEAALLAALD
jgi:pimeloyl-ACP methyl ester carboxylesterase